MIKFISVILSLCVVGVALPAIKSFAPRKIPIDLSGAEIRTIIGTSYAAADLLCYVVGIMFVFAGIFLYRKLRRS